MNDYNMQNRDEKHKRKMVAPIVITVLLCIYYAFYIAICCLMPVPGIVKVIFGILPFLFICLMLYVLMERIKEIRSGVEDDLSNY